MVTLCGAGACWLVELSVLKLLISFGGCRVSACWRLSCFFLLSCLVSELTIVLVRVVLGLLGLVKL